jgi:hypothetical protein
MRVEHENSIVINIEFSSSTDETDVCALTTYTRGGLITTFNQVYIGTTTLLSGI